MSELETVELPNLVTGVYDPLKAVDAESTDIFVSFVVADNTLELLFPST
eukprot:Gb_30588 [translate_table: standard]